MYRALVFLVISCPCALVVSIPLGYFGGIGAASRLGILFKGGNYLDAIARINTVVFDKTGTLTKGTFEVQSCHTPQGISEEKLLQVIASAEQNSTHPIAKAITGYAKQRHILLSPATEVTEIAGRGLEARIDGQRVLAGNTRLLSEYKVEYPQELSRNRRYGGSLRHRFSLRRLSAAIRYTERRCLYSHRRAESFKYQ